MPTKKQKSLTVAQIAVLEQPRPTPNQHQPCFVRSIQWLLGKGCDDLIEAIEARKELGFDRYGVYLQMDNGRCPIVDAFQEAVDLELYLNQEYQEKFSATKGEDAVTQAELDEITKDFYAIAEVAGRILKRAQLKHG